MADVAITIVGGGVVGLAIAAELAPHVRPLFVLERNSRYGMETSSRNSEVIHAGIYYPPGSLKATLCVEGNRLLYDLCQRHGIAHRRITKIITATEPDDIAELETLLRRGVLNGAPLERLTPAAVSALEPAIRTHGGLLSPSTGIVSAHELMDYLAHSVRESGGDIQHNCAVVGIERGAGAYAVTIEEQGVRSVVTSDILINAAGLEADTVAALAGIDIDAAGYRLVYAKGSYFALPGSYRNVIHRLVYPAPTAYSLGVHVVLDLAGRVRFGPDVEYLQGRTADYSVDEGKRRHFGDAARRILPDVKDEDLTPDLAGIRPKLQRHGEAPKDFVIREESDRGLPGMVNLVGIESPGLTASLAIGRYVARLLGC